MGNAIQKNRGGISIDCLVPLVTALILTGCPAGTTKWKEPKADLEVTAGDSSVYTTYMTTLDRKGAYKVIGDELTEMPVSFRKIDMLVTPPSGPPITVAYWVGHIGRKWQAVEGNPLGTFVYEGIKLLDVKAKYDDLHPTWQEVETGAAYRGDPDNLIMKSPNTGQTYIVHGRDTFYNPPVLWQGLLFEDPYAPETSGTPTEMGPHSVGIYVKDGGTIAADVTGTDQYGNLLYRGVNAYPFIMAFELYNPIPCFSLAPTLTGPTLQVQRL